MTSLFARKALLPDGWADDVLLRITDGMIDDVLPGATPDDSTVATGCIIPGLCNAHSHAFQRALAGRTEERSPAGRDSFWTWRERMYELAATLDPDLLRAIACQAYTEMLQSGYTTVAEFHYLHRDPATRSAGMHMFEALADAASQTGIRLTYVPVLYERASFHAPKPEGPQELFALSLEQFLEHHEEATRRQSEKLSVGIGAHSLRAVSASSLLSIADAGREAGGPVHLHIAEQQREVDQCLAAYERRPVRWLLENVGIDEQWCLVHATHMDADETRSLAGTGAVVCVCPSTEANLGDGLFPLADYLAAGGKLAIGSDSHISINPFEELRWLEYGQRLATRSRNITSFRSAHVGRELFERAVEGGAQASGQTIAGLCSGAPADLVALYDDDPMLTGHGDESRLDALVFSGYRLPIEGVMVHGEWLVADGEHSSGAATRDAFRAAVAAVGANR
ncbi:MAG: formimidoylglutamate deiminase [Gammaproteobacteria bacterium]|jgi:formimidoylglutamate deiminase|nr:formimidoylglutamate deiminase [Gammaproteobacteria bacterium]MDH3846286.1 formimidoylglutamate deiminase [Gammaproteobacteria bacterium]MDH3904879.1 formimidoylglutamate deiminase [Gammaproteobacteria bacterium]MDH4006293.1 formimidoylglutamate deiminase [Gammaproteobacteria bacterium]NCF58265.1 formimidoylglutamate deiminase [Gammaproteobacteria bacterium]